MKALYRKFVRSVAFRTGRGVTRWHRACHPGGDEWAAWLKLHGGFVSMGENCSIQRNVVITDPAYLSMGNNVRLSGCFLFGHDGSVNMVNRAFGLKLDAVGKIEIGDNVFIGDGARILPGVTIGSNVIIGAGAVVTGDVQSDSLYVGNPARRQCSLQEVVARMTERSTAYPWAALIAGRTGEFDATIEPTLVRMRVRHFYPETKLEAA